VSDERQKFSQPLAALALMAEAAVQPGVEATALADVVWSKRVSSRSKMMAFMLELPKSG
jgi:hypothetical protein